MLIVSKDYFHWCMEMTEDFSCRIEEIVRRAELIMFYKELVFPCYCSLCFIVKAYPELHLVCGFKN